MLSYVSTTVSKRLGLFAVAAGLAACSTVPNPLPDGTDTAWYGNLTKGEKFGATVGQPAANIEDALWTQGYGYEGMVACSSATQSLLGCHANERYLQFQPVQIGRRGHIYLKIENNRISQIGWAFNPAAYLDG